MKEVIKIIKFYREEYSKIGEEELLSLLIYTAFVEKIRKIKTANNIKKFLIDVIESYFPVSRKNKKISNLFSDEFLKKQDFLAWIYQYFHTDIRENLGRKRITFKEAKTHSQHFTPYWVIDFIVKNAFEYLEKKRDIEILDPAAGGGSFLLRAFDEFLGEKEKKVDCDFINEIVKKLYGFEIDRNLVKITYLHFYIKASEYGCLLKNLPNIYHIEEYDLDTKLGFLIPYDKVEKIKDDNTKKALLKKYDVIISNPPYLDSSDYPIEMREILKEYYPDFKKNIFAMFIKKSGDMLKENGVMGMIVPQVLMFNSSFKKTREYVLNNFSIKVLVQLGLGGVFDQSLVDTVIFILKKRISNDEKGFYVKLDEVDRVKKKEYLLNLEELKDYKYNVNQKDFNLLPNKVFAFWIGDEIKRIFKLPVMNDFAYVREGVATGNNKKFLKYHWEVNKDEISCYYPKDKKRWVPYVKGGPYNKWYGNLWWVIDFSEKAYKELKKIGNHLPNEKFYFRRGITYSVTTSKGPTFRYLPKGFIFDTKGSCVFPKNEKWLFNLLALLNSKFASYIFDIVGKSVDLEVGDLKKFPIVSEFLEDEEISFISKIITALKKQITTFIPLEIHYTQSPIHFYGSLSFTLKNLTAIYLYIAILEGYLEQKIFQYYRIVNSKEEIIKWEGNHPLWYPIEFEYDLPYFVLSKSVKKEFNIDEKIVIELSKSAIEKRWEFYIENAKKNFSFKEIYDNPFYELSDMKKISALNLINEIMHHELLTKRVLFLFLNHQLVYERGKITRDVLEKYGLDYRIFEGFFHRKLNEFLEKEFKREHEKLMKKRSLI